MKNDWLKDIHDRMEDFEVNEPQGLWDDICSAKTEHKKYSDTDKSRKKTLLILSSIAAAGLLLFGIFHQNPIGKESVHSSKTRIASTKPESVGNRIPSERILLAENHKPLLQTKKEDVKDYVSEDSIYSATPMQTAEHAEEQNEPQEAVSQEDYHIAKNTPIETFAGDDPIKSIKTSEPRFALSLSTSGGIGAGNRSLFHEGNVCASSSLGESEWIDSPLLGIMAMNRGTETERKVTHHSPIRTGLSLMYRLNDRWSLETGISYALVSSEIHEGSTTNKIQEEQKLHYIGIPVGVSYRLLSLRNLDVYISSNVLAEQCISGQLNRLFILNNKAQEEQTNTITSRPTQFSMGVKAGVQYNLSNQFSVYLEPGYIYYFDDRSSLETVFKERVCDFNLNLGIRLFVGNKY